MSKRILSLFCIEVLGIITVLLFFTIFFSFHLEMFISIIAVVYLPLGIIFNKVTSNKTNKILNRIAMLVCGGIFVFFGPLAMAIISEQSFSIKERIYAGIILKFGLIFLITWPGVYDAIAKIGKKIKDKELEK